MPWYIDMMPPWEQVTKLTAPQHTGKYTFAASWSIPYCLTNQNNIGRMEKIQWRWVITCSEGYFLNATHNVNEEIDEDAIHNSPTSASIDLRNVRCIDGTHLSGDGEAFGFYPVTDRRLFGISIWVRVGNECGWGEWCTCTTWFSQPEPPKISNLTQDTNTGIVSCDITPYTDGAGNNNTYIRTDWKRTITDTTKTGSKRSVVKTGIFYDSAKEISYNVANRQQLVYPQYVCVEVKTVSKGLARDSDWKTKRLYLGQPATPAIVTKKIVCPAYGRSGNVVVPIKLNAKTTHPVTGVKLQYLNNVTYSKASQIPSTAAWQDCGVSDDGKCTSLAVDVNDIVSVRGYRTWIRIKTWNQTESILPRYSAPVQLTKLYKAAPTATDDTCGIVSLTSGSDGTSVTAVIGYTENNTNTGTIIAWSDKSNAWNSTSQPQTYSFSWKDSTRKSTKWSKTTTIAVHGLTEGTKYYFRARRYLESDTGTTYTPWSSKMSIVPALAPSNVVLSAPTVVLTGKGCTVGWTYDGGTQTSWRILSNNKVVTSGTNKKNTATITAAQLKRYTVKGTVSILVEVNTNGGSAKSSATSITIAAKPTLSITVDTCRVQPIIVKATCSTNTADVTIIVRARGSSKQGPGTAPQVSNDVIWSGKVSPKWKAQVKSGKVKNYLAKISLPTNLDLRDKAKYKVSAYAINPTTNLRSTTASVTFSVAWTHQAPQPVATIVPSDVTNSSGIRRLRCRIIIGSSTSALSTDVYDVWRVTPDREQQIYSGAIAGSTIIDKFAPYARDGVNLNYRIVSRTTDGDRDWDDFSYTLLAYDFRIDFNNTYVALPYNLEVSDSWTKDFEGRRKLDGSIDGYWNNGAVRKSEINTNLIKITDADTAAKVKELAAYAGPCLVRLPDGSCYEANVDVDELSWKYNEVLMTVAIKTVEIDLTTKYAATLSS